MRKRTNLSSSRATARRSSTRKSPSGAAGVPTAATAAPAAVSEAAPPSATLPPPPAGSVAAFQAARVDYLKYREAVKVVEDIQDDLRKARRNVTYLKSRIFGLLGEELPLFEQNSL